MALVVADRVQETSTTTGTGALTLAGAVTGFQSFSTAIGNGNTTYYTITDQSSSTNWEVGLGTYTSAGNTLSRTTILASSASGAAVNFTSGALYVFGDYPAAKAVYLDASGNLTLANPLALTSGGTGASTAPAAHANLFGFTTTATAGGTTTLTNTSSYYQVFTGTSAQTVQLPATSTLQQGWSFHIVNNSTGALTVQTSTAVSLGTIPSGVTMMPSVLTTSGNTATDWETGYTDFSTLTGTGNNVLSSSPTLSYVTLAAGTATAGQAPLYFTSGTNLTAAAAGAVEYDGTSFYSSMAASTRGIIRSEQMVVLNTAYTLTSQTAAQKLFNATTNGAVTLPIGTYQFECFYSLSSMSATSGSFGFAMVAGTAVIGSQGWRSIAQKGTATLATATAGQLTYSTAANTTLATASTNTVGYAFISGVIKITTAGTVIPSVSLGVAAAAVVGINSYFKIAPVTGASAANITVGNWS